MKTLLVIAPDTALAAAIQAVLPSNGFRVHCHREILQAETLLRHGIIDACLLDTDLKDVRPISLVRQIRDYSPGCPILICAGATSQEWEEEAYLSGVSHVLAKPIRGRLLNALLERLWSKEAGEPRPIAEAAGHPPGPPPLAAPRAPARALAGLREFLALLAHGQNSQSLLHQFLLLLREILGVNRAAIFLRQPWKAASEPRSHPEDRVLRPACAQGLDPGLLAHCELSLESGIGRHALQTGRILTSAHEEFQRDRTIQEEFARLGIQVAIPIMDRERLVGVALLDRRLTGEFFAGEELALIFHLLEGVGLALRSNWLHDQVAESHAMLADILDQLESGCVVVNREMEILHANPAAQKLLCLPSQRGAQMQFQDIPQALGSRIYEALQTAMPQQAFRYHPPSNPDAVYQIRIAAFRTRNSITANAVLMLIDDVTQQEHFHQLALEASRLRLIKSMASQLAHEIGNSMVPILTSQELAEKKQEDVEVRTAIIAAATDGIRRIARLSKQMQYLADDNLNQLAPVPVRQLVQSAFAEAERHFGKKSAEPRLEDNPAALSLAVSADVEKLTHALSEILLNALQAGPVDGPPIQVLWQTQAGNSAESAVCLQIKDAGRGFALDSAAKATDPFYSTRTVGLGLGLTVARQIIELHRGRLDIAPSEPGSGGVVRVYLPWVEPV